MRDIKDLVINVANPQRLVKKIKTTIDSEQFRSALSNEEVDYKEIEKLINNYLPGHQDAGFFWAVIRDVFAERQGEDIIKELGYIPADFFAYFNFPDELDLSDSTITEIKYSAFYSSNLETIKLPVTLEKIEGRAFVDLSTNSLTIYYAGTKKQWRSIKKDSQIFGDPYSNRFDRAIKCSDGDIEYYI